MIEMHIRKATIEDLTQIMQIYKTAQDFMINNGNPSQWGRTYPGRNLIKKDIENEACNLICDNTNPHGVFALYGGDEPTYQQIEDGEWLNDYPYVTVHRIASDGKLHGIFSCTVRYCKRISDNIRIDTHNCNKVMQRHIESNGFKRCGTIYVSDGSPRIAYQWTKCLNDK